jgi:hypothetical protein
MQTLEVLLVLKNGTPTWTSFRLDVHWLFVWWHRTAHIGRSFDQICAGFAVRILFPSHLGTVMMVWWSLVVCDFKVRAEFWWEVQILSDCQRFLYGCLCECISFSISWERYKHNILVEMRFCPSFVINSKLVSKSQVAACIVKCVR